MTLHSTMIRSSLLPGSGHLRLRCLFRESVRLLCRCSWRLRSLQRPARSSVSIWLWTCPWCTILWLRFWKFWPGLRTRIRWSGLYNRAPKKVNLSKKGWNCLCKCNKKSHCAIKFV
ncbi:hypothetical protein MTO96_033495 [Rhipicephalus appendiculatus]